MEQEALTFQELERIMQILEATPRDGTVKVELNGMKVKVSRGERVVLQPAPVVVPAVAAAPAQQVLAAAPAVAAAPADAPAPAPAVEQPAVPVAAEPAPQPRPAQAAVAAGHPVVSPLTGVFYRKPSPDADPFVVEGQRVEAGEVLAIIEVMKLMNRLTAPVSGIVRQIAAENEDLVEQGAVLFVIDTEGVAS